jgi:hypothetical protein
VSLKQRTTNEVTLLVFYTLPQSLPRLSELASAEPGFRAARARIIALPLGQSSPSAGAGTAGDVILATTRSNVAAAYAMFARRSSGKGDVALEHAEFLLDAEGYLRARWIGVPAPATDRTAETLSQIKLLDDEPPRAAPEEHVH